MLHQLSKRLDIRAGEWPQAIATSTAVLLVITGIAIKISEDTWTGLLLLAVIVLTMLAAIALRY